MDQRHDPETVTDFCQRVVEDIAIRLRHLGGFQVQGAGMLRQGPVKGGLHLFPGILLLAQPLRHVAANLQADGGFFPCLVEPRPGRLCRCKALRVIIAHMAPAGAKVAPVAPAVSTPARPSLHRIGHGIIAVEQHNFGGVREGTEVHIDIAVEQFRGIAFLQRRQGREVAVMPLSPRADHADVDESQLRVVVVTRAKRLEKTLGVGQIGGIIQIRHKGLMIRRPGAFDPFIDQPLRDL